jgi:hypothetical protein
MRVGCGILTTRILSRLSMPWFAIRTVYRFSVKADGTNVFEERVVAFEAASTDEAHRKADVESGVYAKQNNLLAHSEQSGYRLDAEPLIDGQEVWSELFEAHATLNEFYAGRYSAYLYTPDLPEIS